MKFKSSIPPSVQHQINEWTSGGYALFFVNKDGDPEIIASFDNSLNMLGLHAHIKNWVKAAEEVGVEEIVDSMLIDDSDVDIIEEDDSDEEDIF